MDEEKDQMMIPIVDLPTNATIQLQKCNRTIMNDNEGDKEEQQQQQQRDSAGLSGTTVDKDVHDYDCDGNSVKGVRMTGLREVYAVQQMMCYDGNSMKDREIELLLNYIYSTRSNSSLELHSSSDEDKSNIQSHFETLSRQLEDDVSTTDASYSSISSFDI
jgi:hypothetical protein